MKNLFVSLMIALMSVMASTPAVAKNSKSDVKNLIPKNIVVKQATRFNDGRTLVIYYKKQGTNCEVYSPCEAKDYDVSIAPMQYSVNSVKWSLSPVFRPPHALQKALPYIQEAHWAPDILPHATRFSECPHHRFRSPD